MRRQLGTPLRNSADKVVLDQGKLEFLIVSAQEISASVAQLYVSSRVKAKQDSDKLAQLGQASKRVNECTAAVVASVKDGKQSLEEEGNAPGLALTALQSCSTSRTSPCTRPSAPRWSRRSGRWSWRVS